MPTSRPLVAGDIVVAISLPLTPGESYSYPIRNTEAQYVLSDDFHLPNRGVNNWWVIVGERLFGIRGYSGRSNVILRSSIDRGTAPALYVREGDIVEPWDAYQQTLAQRVLAAQETKHQGLIAQLQLHGAVNIQLRVEDDVVVIRCSGRASVLEGFAAEGVRVEALPAQSAVEWRSEYMQTPTDRLTTNDGPTYAEIEQAVARTTQQRRILAQAAGPPLRGLNFSQSQVRSALISDEERRRLTERWATVVGDPFAVEPPPPPPTRFNLLECDLPAVDPTPVKQKHFDALADLQASFRATKVVTKTAVQSVLTRFDLLECDEPAEPVTIKPKWSAPARMATPAQPAPPERRTVEDILDLTTSGPLEAFAALQIAKAEIARDLWHRKTN